MLSWQGALSSKGASSTSLFDLVSANELYDRDGIVLANFSSWKMLKGEEAGKQLRRGETATPSIYCVSEVKVTSNHIFWYTTLPRNKMKQLSQWKAELYQPE